GELVFVVAVFRHGVRAPLADFAAHADEHASQHWPATPAEWGAKDWGDLTARGAILAARVGEYYGTHYTTVRPEGFKAYLWAELGQLEAVLACNKAETGCTPLSDVTDVAKPWIDGHERKEPVEWKGRFSYASSASEAFLLEQANLMQVAWGRNPDIARLLRLH